VGYINGGIVCAILMVMLAMFQFASCDKLPEDRAVSTGFEVQISGMKLDDCWICRSFSQQEKPVSGGSSSIFRRCLIPEAAAPSKRFKSGADLGRARTGPNILLGRRPRGFQGIKLGKWKEYT
jgi:hypothetical protein